MLLYFSPESQNIEKPRGEQENPKRAALSHPPSAAIPPRASGLRHRHIQHQPILQVREKKQQAELHHSTAVGVKDEGSATKGAWIPMLHLPASS